MLAKNDFKHLVKNAPLFAIDLVMLNEQNQILLGQPKKTTLASYILKFISMPVLENLLEMQQQTTCEIITATPKS